MRPLTGIWVTLPTDIDTTDRHWDFSLVFCMEHMNSLASGIENERVRELWIATMRSEIIASRFFSSAYLEYLFKVDFLHTSRGIQDDGNIQFSITSCLR